MEEILAINQLNLSFRKGQQSLPVLKNVSFEINSGDKLVIIGQSGSGKSTLVDTILGILPENAWIESGTLTFKGKTIDLSQPPYTKEGGSQFNLSIIFQDAKDSLNPSQRIIDQFKDYLTWHKICPSHLVKEKATSALEKLGLQGVDRILTAYPHQLSGGMAQRVAIALLSLGPGEVLVADEPTSALDKLSSNEVIETLQQINNQTMIIISHDLRVAEQLATKIMVLNHGEVMEFGPKEQILHAPQNPYTQSLIKSYKQVDQLQHSEIVSPNTILSVKNVNKTYGSYQALQNIQFDLKEGEIFGILGASGSGKSTISRLIMGIESADSGEIRFNDTDLLTLSTRKRRKLASEIQIIFQNPRQTLNPRYPIIDLVKEVLINTGNYPAATMQQLAVDYLKRVGLGEHYLKKRPPELSTGQCQRVAIVRAIISNPHILICDEAISSLDQNIQADIIELLLDLKEQLAISMIMITHDIRVLRGISNRILVLKEGKQIGIYTSQELDDSEDSYIKKLLA